MGEGVFFFFLGGDRCSTEFSPPGIFLCPRLPLLPLSSSLFPFSRFFPLLSFPPSDHFPRGLLHSFTPINTSDRTRVQRHQQAHHTHTHQSLSDSHTDVAMTPTVSNPPPPHSPASYSTSSTAPSFHSPSTIPTGLFSVLKATTPLDAPSQPLSHSPPQQQQQQQLQQTGRPIVSSPWTIQAYSVSEKGDKDTVRGSATVGVPTAVARSMLLQALQFWYRVPIKVCFVLVEVA